MVTIESRTDTDVSLVEFLSQRARHASDARLAIDAGTGFVVAVAATFWRGAGWYLLAAAALCFLAYGSWGIADRELGERRATERAGAIGLRMIRGFAIALGLVAAITFVLGAMAILLGRMIS